MQIFDNISNIVKDDLKTTITKNSKLSIAVACFSIYAFEELKEQLKDISELNFIFTSPTFIKERELKEKREFYIPQLNRERSLYGSNNLYCKDIYRDLKQWSEMLDEIVAVTNDIIQLS